MSRYQTPNTPPHSRRDLRAYIPPATPATWATLGVGALLGLVLGLFIGWQVWPVQWTAAWPGDLSREARAQYLAAVADAYVFYGDEEAAELARNRLFDLNTDLEAQIADAIDFFSATRPRNFNATITNLGQLAQGLDAAPITPTDASGVGDTVRAWVNWTLTVLAAILLAAGGIWVVNRMQQRRTRENGLADDPGGFDDEDSVEALRPAVGVRPFMRPASPTAVRPTSEPSTRATAFDTAHAEEYGFEDEAHDAYRPNRPIATGDDYALRDEEFEAEGPFADDAGFDGAPARTRVDADYSDDAFTDDDLSDDESSPSARYTVISYDDLDETETLPASANQSSRSGVVDPFEAMDAEEDAMVQPSSEPVAAPPPTRSSRKAKAARVLQNFSVHYRAGLPELNKSYNQAYTIVDPESGRAIGECGMMVNSINGILDNDPDSVIAMEVWLVDKKQELTFSSRDRILISEYAYDRGLETKITRDRPNDPRPIIPQAGRTPFEIKGPHLHLQCEVVEAIYAKSGPRKGVFESLRIEMTVLDQD